MHGEKVHQENKAIKLEEELETLQGDYEHLWDETTRLFNHASGRAAHESVGKGIQETSTVLEKLQLAVEVMKKDHVEIFKQATPNCTGKGYSILGDGGRGRTNTKLHWQKTGAFAVCWQP